VGAWRNMSVVWFAADISWWFSDLSLRPSNNWQVKVPPHRLAGDLSQVKAPVLLIMVRRASTENTVQSSPAHAAGRHHRRRQLQL